MAASSLAMSYTSQENAIDWMNSEHLTGTSIMAVEFDGGVVVGADSRTTTGSFIANRITDKLTRVTDNIYCCRSGSAADTQAVADIVTYQLEMLRIQMGENPQVQTAAHLFRNICYEYRDQLSAGIICAGWDERAGGQVFSIPLGGMAIRQPFAIGGSGSTYVYGHVDHTFKPNMNKSECLKFVSETLALAMARDGSSGGVIRMVVLTKDGAERHLIPGNELPTFYDL